MKAAVRGTCCRLAVAPGLAVDRLAMAGTSLEGQMSSEPLSIPDSLARRQGLI